MINIYICMPHNEGNRKKLADLYEKNKYLLLRYALNITSNQSMAEDAVHGTFVSILENKDKYLKLSFEDFLRLSVVIVRNKSIDLLRDQKPYTKKSMAELEIFLQSNEVAVDEQVILLSEYDLIRKHLNSIDEISRQILLMKYIHSMTYKEIGKELNMTPKHVDTKIMRAKKKVRKLVNKDVGYSE